MKIIKYVFFLVLINLFIIRVYAKSFEVNVDKNEIDVNKGEIVDILVNVQVQLTDFALFQNQYIQDHIC